MVKKILALALLALTLSPSLAQTTQIGTGFFSTANFGPLRTDTTSSYYSKFAFTYPATTLSNLQHGDSIRALSFFYDEFDSMRGNCSMRILLASSASADFGPGAINWDSISREGMTEVYSGNPKIIIGDLPGEVIFGLDKAYRWDTTGGRIHLRMLVEFIQTTNQTGNFSWYVENNFSVPNFVSFNESKFIYEQSTTGIDSITNRTTSIKPTLKIYHQSHRQDLAVDRIYSLGIVPVLMRRADTIRARLINVGIDTVYGKKVYLNVRGANTMIDSATVGNVAPYESTLVNFGSHQAVNIGTETLTVRLEPDDNQDNDSLNKPREVNYNIYSQSDPFSPLSPGGIGFGSGATGDFVSKFYVEGASYINQIAVDFGSNGVEFQLGIWDDDGPNGTPGSLIFLSDTQLTTTSSFIFTVLPRVQVSGGYFVGIREPSASVTSFVSFSYQAEDPIRPNTFYFSSPVGSPEWRNFDPGFNFNVNIRPRLQVANDLAVLDILSPINGDSILNSTADSIDLIARVINFGYQNQGSFEVRGQVFNRFNQLEETRTAIVSLNAADTITINFGKLSKFRLGEYTFRVNTSLPKDSIRDNDSKEVKFYFIKEYDVAVDQIFNPIANQQFSIRRDPILTIVRVANYGVKNHVNLPVVLQLLNSENEVVHNQLQLIDLEPLSTEIISFDTTYLPINGEFTLRAFTDLSQDSIRANDSLYVFPLLGIKTDDMLISGVTRPTQNQKVLKNESIRPFVSFQNDGLDNQDSVVIEATILDQDGIVIYYDSVHRTSSFFSIRQALFDPVVLDSVGDYTFITHVTIVDDQVPENDTARVPFSVVTGNDLRIVSLVHPTGIIRLNSPDESVLLAVVNVGLNDAVDVPFSIEIEDNTGTVVYDDLVSISLASGSADTIEFKDLKFDKLGDFYVTATNDWLLEEQRVATDTLRSTYIIRNGIDISIVSHTAPVDTIEIGEETIPRLTLANSGIDTAFDVVLVITIRDASNVVVGADTLTIERISPNTQININSSKVWSWDKGGIFTLRSELLTTDENQLNNELATSFVVPTRRDMGVAGILNPVSDQNIRIGTLNRPAATVINNGLQDIIDAEVVCDVKVGLLTIYRNRQVVSIAAGQSATVIFDSSLTYAEVARATAMFTVESLQDQISSNDTLSSSFNFVQGVGVAELDSKLADIFPNPVEGSFQIYSDLLIKKVILKNDLGAVIWKKEEVNSKNLAVSMEYLSSGNYFVEIITTTGTITKTIIKQ